MVPPINNINITSENVRNLTDSELDIVIAEKKRRIEENARQEIKVDFQEDKEHKYDYLLNKPNMTAIDNENMKKSVDFLIEKNMDTSENLKKLESIRYGSDYREIGWIRFSREKFVPNVKFNDKPNEYGVFKSEKEGIYKALYNWKPEYYLTADAYGEQAKQQWKKTVKDTHIRQALMALPCEFMEDDIWYVWWNILWNILNLSRSGRIPSLSEWPSLLDENTCCYLGSDYKMRHSHVRGKMQGGLYTYAFMEIDHSDLSLVGNLTKQSPTNARPCLYIV